MTKTLLAMATGIALLSGPAIAQLPESGQPEITLEQRMLLRCSAAFALVARAQQNGEKAALAWPDLSERGSEYFVHASARVMDEARLGREEIARALTAEAQNIVREGTRDTIMPSCLLSLEASEF